MLQEININWIDIPFHQPDFIEIKKSNIEGLGAFSKDIIKKNTFLGHYMGKISKDFSTGPYTFHSHRENVIISIDASDKNYSNWTRYMNCSSNYKKENVNAYFLTNKENYIRNDEKINLEGYIVFYANRDIEKGEELMYYYGNAYAKILNVCYKC